jgi:ubiquinone/menaquinone biosynthesis C-methylase UbiE
MDKIKKLHLGCGSKRINGFINIDVREDESVDLVDDIKYLDKFELNSASLIYSSHVLEHFGRKEYKDVLKRWYDVLEPNGVLRIAVPDLEQVINHYNLFKNIEILRGFLYGGQTYTQNYHYCGWDFNSLQKDLLDIGFKSIKRYDWRETEHNDIDDFSQSYLPHMQKESGMLMSLNVEAIK